LPPKNIKSAKLKMKAQKRIFWVEEKEVWGLKWCVGAKGKKNKDKIAAPIKITPPNLLGHARKIA